MTTLIELINQHAASGAAAGNWGEVAGVLNAQTMEIRNPRPLTYARLTDSLGDDVRALVAGTLRAIAKSASPLAGEIEDAHRVLLDENVGLRIDSDARQAIIDQLATAGGWPAGVTDAIKQAGVLRTSLAAAAGLGIVTAEQCQDAFAAALAEARIQSLQQRFDAIKNQIGTPEQIQAVAALRGMADELESD